MLGFKTSIGLTFLLLTLHFNNSYQWDRKRCFVDCRFAQTDVSQPNLKNLESSIKCNKEFLQRGRDLNGFQRTCQNVQRTESTFSNHNRYIMASIPTPIQYTIERTILDPQPLQDGWDRAVKIARKCTQISTGLAGLVGTWLGVGQSPRSSFKHIGWLKARRVSDVTDDFTVWSLSALKCTLCFCVNPFFSCDSKCC
jgi:hypothetical protein